MNVSGFFEYSRFGQGLVLGEPFRAAVGGRYGVVRKGSFPLLGRLGL